MRTYFRPLYTAVLTATLSTLAGHSLAQPAPSADPSVAQQQHPHQHQNPKLWRHDPAQMQAHMAKRLAALKAKLNITPAQATAWDAYTENLSSHVHMPPTSAPDLRQLPTPERLDRMRAFRAEHQAAMTARIDQRAQNTKTFYAALDVDQQKTFDAEFNRAADNHGHRMGPMNNQPPYSKPGA
jgi:protein CpxP